MRNLIAFLIVDGLLIVGATANQFYQGWATREALKPTPVEPEPECVDSIVVAYPGNPISKTGWLNCEDNQSMYVEYPIINMKKLDPNLNVNAQKIIDSGLPYMIVNCKCKEDISDTGV